MDQLALFAGLPLPHTHSMTGLRERGRHARLGRSTMRHILLTARKLRTVSPTVVGSRSTSPPR